MRAIILAAGRGSRLSPLTDTCPKPLLPVNGRPIIDYHLESLKRAGIVEVVINTCYLGDLIQKHVKNGVKWGLSVQYSEEKTMLESGGGIFNALPLLGSEPFLVLNADMITDYPFETLVLSETDDIWLVCVPNTAPFKGDFDLKGDRVFRNSEKNPYTFSGISIVSPRVFVNHTSGKFSMVPLYLETISKGRLGGELYLGQWAALELLNEYKMFSKDKQ
jgi:N-acetyl-alpha-D-muramate 1-phosphate uridylyltransferase